MKISPLLFVFGLVLTVSADDLRPVVDQLSPAEVKKTWEKLNALIAKSGGIDPNELERARLQGVLQKLGKNVRLVARPGVDHVQAGVDFKSEMLPRLVLYARLGDLSADNVSQLGDTLRKQSKARAVILDLRDTRGEDVYDSAAGLIALFTGGGKTAFTLVNSGGEAPKAFAGQGDAVFSGILLVLVNGDSNGPAEVTAAALRQQARALIVGAKTKGEALDFSTILTNDRVNLEVAVGRVVLPGLPQAFLENGVQPDLVVPTRPDDEREILRRSGKEGITPFIFEIERPHMNEASLVAGRNPELDNYQDQKTHKTESEPAPLIDRTLQRALDAATALLVLQDSSKTGG